jgi:pantetheine-phosphate adenylyltransferase
MKKAVFPGSFDPITLGHIDIVKRSLLLFDEIIIAIGINADKKYMFSIEDRKKHIEDTFKNEPKIKVKTYNGLTVDFCIKEQAGFILRGLRNSSDFNYEQSIAQTNASLASIESVFIMCSPPLSNISSSIVRDVIRNGGDYSKMVPRSVLL